VLRKIRTLFNHSIRTHELSEENRLLYELFLGHGFNPSVQGSWLRPDDTGPAVRATWQAQENSGILVIELKLFDGRNIYEVFVGTGDDPMKSALYSFIQGVLHVMLAAFWNLIESDHVLLEEWRISDQVFTAFVGNVSTKITDENDKPQLPTSFFLGVENAIKELPLPKSLAWFRFYSGHLADCPTHEALENNESWPKGIQMMHQIDWPRTTTFYSFRLFLILRRKDA
jgi:Family of unknown function (DUF6348)